MSDLISREDAIEAVASADATDGTVKVFTGRQVNGVLSALPSAEAETKCVAQIKVDTEEIVRRIKEKYDITDGWVPCSERLPAKRRSVLITTSEGFVGEACYWETTENHVIWKGYRWNATYWDDEVLAWMPLPVPYREESEVEE